MLEKACHKTMTYNLTLDSEIPYSFRLPAKVNLQLQWLVETENQAKRN
jgi:hypothetical protein